MSPPRSNGIDTSSLAQFMVDMSAMVKSELKEFKEELGEDYRATNERVTKIDDKNLQKWEDHLRVYHIESGAQKSWLRSAAFGATIAIAMAGWALIQIVQNSNSIASLNTQTMNIVQAVGQLQAQKNANLDPPDWFYQEPKWMKGMRNDMSKAIGAMKSATSKVNSTASRKDPKADANTKRLTDYFTRKSFRPGEIN